MSSLNEKALSLLLPISLISCGVPGERSSNRMGDGKSPEQPMNEENSIDPEVAFNLTFKDCQDQKKLDAITVSPQGSLFINHPDVLSSAVESWSFGFLMREILELPAPSKDPKQLATEQATVDRFLNFFVQQELINSYKPPIRQLAADEMRNVWGKERGSDSKDYRVWSKAPFKLMGITNRLDLVKKGLTDQTAGEGRFVFKYTGTRPMTIIFEYDLPIGKSSPFGMTLSKWAQEWHALKNFLVDTKQGPKDPPGVQPDQTKLDFSNRNGYLQALENLTKKFTTRQTRGTTFFAAPISQIRTNEFLEKPWELREIVRTRPGDSPQLYLTTVKNNPDHATFNKPGSPEQKALSTWLDKNVTCSLGRCTYTTVDAKLPSTIDRGDGRPIPLLAATAPTLFGDWSSFQRSEKGKFMALSSCNGCHATETKTAFVHINIANSSPSAFLRDDLTRRETNLKNLICLAATSVSDLNLAADAGENSLRVGTSNMAH